MDSKYVGKVDEDAQARGLLSGIYRRESLSVPSLLISMTGDRILNNLGWDNSFAPYFCGDMGRVVHISELA